jgi:DNA-binding Lrp family transcriptional regulator
MMDEIDRQLVKLTQSGLPLVPEPYQQLAEQLSIETEEVMRRFQNMKQQGIIRRIAAVPNHYKLGYRYNGMTVWNVEDSQIDSLGQQVGRLDFVSHCYQRPRHLPDWPYNLFAMVHSRTPQGVEEQVKTIAMLLGEFLYAHEILYSRKILKKTGLRIR